MVAETRPSTQERSVCIDWMKARIRARFAKEFRAAMLERFGDSEPAPGGNGLPMSDSWMEGAVKLYHDQDGTANCKDFAYIQITGTGCSLLGPTECIELTRLILDEWGGRFTRFDGAIDHEGDYQGMIDRILKGCNDGQLVGARSFGLDESADSVIPLRMSITATKAKGVTGQTLYIGARGKQGSGRFLRVYDKGLQTGQAEAGRWIRYELEATRDVANQMARVFVDSDDQTRMRAVYDCIEFREVASESDRHLARRPVCQWWAEIVGDDNGANIRRASRRDSTAATHVKWMAEAVLPNVFAVAKRLGITVEDVCVAYCGEIQSDGTAKGGALLLLDEIEADKWGGKLHDIYSFLFDKTVKESAA